MTKPLIGQRVLRNEDPRLLTGQAQFVDDVEIPGLLHAAFLRSDHAHARLLSIDVSAARQRPGVVAVYTAEDMGDDWQPGPPLVSPPPTAKDVVFYSRRQVPLVKDKIRHAGEAMAVVIAESRYIAEDAVEDIVVDLEPLEAVVDLERALQPDSPLVHDDLEFESGRPSVPEEGRLRSRSRAGRPGPPAPDRHRPRCGGRHGESRHRRRVGREEPASHAVGHDAGAHPNSQRDGRPAGPLGEPGAGDRPLHRRRVRPQDDDVLSRGAGDPLGGQEAEAPDQVDRGPAGELLRHHPGARADPRRRDRPEPRRAHPGSEGRVPARHRRLRSLRADHPPQHPVPRHGGVRHQELRHRGQRGLHQQDFGDPCSGRRATSGDLRDRADAGRRRPRAGHRSGGDPPTQSHPPGCLPLRARDHRPGLFAAHPGQRELLARDAEGPGDDRLRGVRPRRATPPAQGGEIRGHRHHPLHRVRRAWAPTKARV